MNGIELITQERKKQLSKFSITSDTRYVRGELLMVATALIQSDAEHWPRDWDISLFTKWMKTTCSERLAIAAAFIAAEIDSINIVSIEDNETYHEINF